MSFIEQNKYIAIPTLLPKSNYHHGFEYARSFLLLIAARFALVKSEFFHCPERATAIARAHDNYLLGKQTRQQCIVF